MRKLLLLTVVVLLSTASYAQKRGKGKASTKGKVMFWQLDDNRGRMFIPNHMEPYTGFAYEEWGKGKNKSKIPFKDGIVHGTLIQWNVNGKKISEANFERGVKHGLEKQWYDNGKPKVTVEYLNGKPNGVITEYFESGQKQSTGAVRDGVNYGKHTWWFKNGQKDQELTYDGGQAEGKIYNWYPDGKQKMIASYSRGIKNGKTEHWYPNGNKRSVQHYIQNVETDTSSFWEKDGLLSMKKVYNKGQLIKTMDYREASILTRDGYMHIFNKLNSNFLISISGEKVTPIDAEVLAFLVDGKAIEIMALPLSLMYDEGEVPTDETEILQKHKNVEVTYLKELFEVEELPITEQYERTRRSQQYLIWEYQTPQKEEDKEVKLVVKSEVNAVIVCQNYLLHLTAPVVNAQKSADIQRTLQAIIETIDLRNEPIDVIALSESMR